MTLQTSTSELEQGSFRDRDSRVFYANGQVFRALNERGVAEWERLAAARFFPRLVEAGRIVATERVEPEAAPEAPGGPWAGLLRHETIPFVSYPYEWSFGMLRDAALLTLELVAEALKEDMILKDATPYNVQWRGATPTFIDVPSFVRLAPGEPWVGYRQFCELFLYPLLLQAYKDVPFHPWLRGHIDGITAEQMKGLMSLRDRFRPGVMTHVLLSAAIQARYAGTDRDMRKEVKDAGFHKELIQANVRKLTRLVRGLEWKRGASTWSDYATNTSYEEADRERKVAFVREATKAAPRGLVWDLGCNTGDYSRVAAEHAERVLAMDADHLAIERLYRSLEGEEGRRILPLVIQLADSSPNQGWRGAERKDLASRGRPDLTLALALVHHVVIAANVPLAEFVDWLAELGGDLVIEFVTRDDPMVKTLLRNKEDKYTDYDQGFLERKLAEHWEVVRQEDLVSGTRTLYFGRRRT